MKRVTSPPAVHTKQLSFPIARLRSELLLLVGVIVVALLLRLPGLTLPLERDEGAYAYFAWTWLHGGLPYRDAFDHKPPLVYLLYMPPLLLGAPSAWAIRVWATLLFLVDVALVYAIGRRVWQRHAALIAALIFGVAGSAFDLQGLVLNTDQALVLPALVALWSAIRLRETQRFRFALVVGAALAATILIKPVAIVLIPALLLVCPHDRRGMARVAGGVALGALIVGLPLAGYFILRGGWNDLVFGVLTYNRLYASESQARWQLGALVDMFAPFVPLLLVALGGVALLLRRSEQAPIVIGSPGSGWLVAAWGAALLIAAIGSLRAYIHYYYPLLPFLALLAAPCVLRLWQRDPAAPSLQRSANYLAAILLGALLLVPFARQNLQLLGTSAEQQAERLYGDVGKHYFAQAPLVAEYIRAHTQPDDYVYIFAAEPEVYLLAERRASSRYIYDYPLSLVPGASAELLRDLAAKPPKLVITYYGVRPDGLYQTLNAHSYVKLTEIGGYELYGAQQ